MNSERLNKLANSKITITAHERFPGGTFTAQSNLVIEDMPPFYRVRLIMKPVAASYIVTEIWLPDEDNWNGRFLGLGNGGLAGLIRYKDLGKFVKLGYACANTDLGTSRGESSGVNCPAVWDDFGWRATHLMTVAGKKAVRLYYGKCAKKSYFFGSSTGGQQAISEAERFPRDYDGIVSGVAAMNRTSLHVYFLWNWLAMRREDGTPAFDAEKIALINRLAVEFFKTTGGTEPDDAFISLPWDGEKTAKCFVSYIKENSDVFTDEELERLEKYYSGPKDRVTGERIYCGVPIGAEASKGGLERACGEKSAYFFPFIWAFGAGYKANSFDFSSDYRKLNEILASHVNATGADLRAFAEAGGKMIGFSGTADPTVPYPESLSFYDRAARISGGYGKLGECFRFYMIPGRAHKGGPGATDLYAPDDKKRNRGPLAAIERWVEKGRPPFEMTAVSKPDEVFPEKELFERTVYPYGLSKECPFTPENHAGGCENPY